MRPIFDSKRFKSAKSRPESDAPPAPKYCCIAFENFVNDAGKRGFGIFTHDYGDSDLVFIFQFRALDPDGHPPNAPSPLTLITEIQLRFCPWCGVDLQEFYQTRLKELERPDLKLG